MRVAVIGACSAVGRHLVPRLIEARYQPRACVRTPGSAPSWLGVEERRADILDAESVRAAIEGCEAVVNVASSIPRPDRAGGDWAVYDHIRREGMSNVLRACSAAGATLVQQSIAMLHRAVGDSPQDEDAPLQAKGVIAAALDLEQAVQDWSGDWRLVRGGSLYDPGTGRAESWFEVARRGDLRTPGDGQAGYRPSTSRTWLRPS